MSYDFVVGKSAMVKDQPVVVGSMDFDDLPDLGRLLKKGDSFFLSRLSNFFADTRFGQDELRQAQDHLLQLLPQSLSGSERALLHKLISVVSFALDAKQPLHGIAD